jgi:hypothetical protein
MTFLTSVAGCTLCDHRTNEEIREEDICSFIIVDCRCTWAQHLLRLYDTRIRISCMNLFHLAEYM